MDLVLNQVGKAESYSYEATGLTPIWYYYDYHWSYKFAGFFETIFDRSIYFLSKKTKEKSYYYVSILNKRNQIGPVTLQLV